ncbi:MAG TPA: hybrid sensor histidine kinase/response regulator, partial [Albitalea sp.]
NRPGGEARVETALHEGTVALRVVDTGRGLTEEQRAHLFEPFNRLGIDRQGIEGTGIGLAIVKTLATRMGGTIAVHSTPGQGSTFEVLLLRADPAEPDAQRAPGAPAAPARAARGQLLYIEDNPINVMLVEELVSSRSGLGIVSEPNGELGVARARALRPDIVLVDMQLPDFDGFEVLRRLKAMPETSHIPCLAVSANAMPEDIRRALEAGFLEYWTKPIDFTAFLQSIETLLAAR